MAKKSAASLKPKHAAVTEDIDIEKEFEEAKAGLVMIIKAQIRNCARIDNLWDSYKEIVETCKNDMVDPMLLAEEACVKMVDVYKNVLDIVENLELSRFTADEYVDPIAKFVPTNNDCNSNFSSLYLHYVAWRCIRPVGEKLEQLYMLIQDYSPKSDDE